jgi:hypothetical protein
MDKTLPDIKCTNTAKYRSCKDNCRECKDGVIVREPDQQVPSALITLLACPFCGSTADLFHEFDVPRAGCSDDTCPASFGDDGVDAGWWNQRAN